MTQRKTGRTLAGMDQAHIARAAPGWHRKRRLASALPAIFLATGLGACSPMRALDDARAVFDPSPRMIFGPEDVERWASATQKRIGPSRCDRSCAIEQTGLPRSRRYWRPTRSQVRQFEQELAIALRRERWNRRDYDPPGWLSRDSVQYIGYMQGKRRLIYANGSCGDSGGRSHWTLVLDGGACQFRAAFDPDSGEFLGIGFNGLG